MAICSANIPEESMKEKSSKEEVESKKYYDERKSNMMYKRKVRLNQSKEEKELRKIEHVIQMRNNRATKIEENIEIEKRLAREDMRLMRKFGKFQLIVQKCQNTQLMYQEKKERMMKMKCGGIIVKKMKSKRNCLKL